MMDDLELLRGIFADDKLHIAIGTITQLGIARDNSKLRVQVLLLPEEREIVAEMGWADVNIISFPEINDLVLVAFVDGHPDEAFVIKLLSTKEEPLPAHALGGHLVVQSRPGKKSYLSSDTSIQIGRPSVTATQPLVLGTVLVDMLTHIIDLLLNSSQIGYSAFGPVWLDPGIRSNLTTYKSTYLTTTSTNIVSQIGFTERGV